MLRERSTIRKENMVTVELTATEKRVLLTLGDEGGEWNPRTLSEKTSINEDAVMQAAFMLAQRGLCEIKEEKKVYYRLAEEGRAYAEEGLPERRALHFLIDRNGATVEDLRDAFGDEVKIAINWLLKKNWARIEKRGAGRYLIPTVVLEESLSGIDEVILDFVSEGATERGTLADRIKTRILLAEEELNGFLSQLSSRNLVESYSRVEREIAITEAGKEEILSRRGISVEDEIAQLTPELLRTGSWRGRKFKRYDVNLASKEVFPAKIHPYQRLLDRMRRIFTEMGFVEIKGEAVQSAFWNFDALFVPQDHPFYNKMGFPSIRFRPGYFPYTEPSVEVEVYMAERGWIELGGAGIFREEVTNPLGVNYPVLAWGLGIGRLAMISLGLTDIRDLYQPDIDWLRNARSFR